MNATPLPPTVRIYLEALLLNGRQPAYAFIAADGTLQSWGGEMDRYLKQPLHKGRPADDQIDALVGLLPLEGENASIPHLMTDTYRSADLHLVAEAGGAWMILLDSTVEVHQQQTFQQQSNDLLLLKARQLSMLAQLRAHNEHLEAILNQLSVAAVRIAPDGTVTFLNAYAERLLATADGTAATGRPWQQLLPLDSQAAAAFAALLTAEDPAACARVRLALETEGALRHLEADVRLDPRDPAFRITYFYDISELQELRGRLNEKSVFEKMTGKSEPMLRTFQLIRDVARVHATVLIEGETGTGKELVARAIHACSPRKDGPFIVVNCAGFTDSLINSQLFGHKKGSFTDAVSNQIGVFEAAHGGTILLDEIGDIPMNTQTRILRALEQREIIRVGETEARKVDIRILAATNKNLEEEVKRGNFRLDLLYRIRVARVVLPPLRERREDIPLLARTFAAAVAAENEMIAPVIGPDVLAALMAYPWPGNVRELRNAIEFAIIRCRDGMLRCHDLPPEIMTSAENEQHPDAPAPSEKAQLLEALRAENGRRDETARRLGISRATLYRRMTHYHITEADWR